MKVVLVDLQEEKSEWSGCEGGNPLKRRWGAPFGYTPTSGLNKQKGVLRQGEKAWEDQRRQIELAKDF